LSKNSNQVARQHSQEFHGKNGGVARVTQMEVRSGPLPDPETLAKYESLSPGFADRILRQVEVQSAHRQDLEQHVIRSEVSQAKLGLYFGLVVALVGIGGGVTCILWGHDWAGSAISGATLVGLVGTFIYGSVSRRREREGKVQPKPLPSVTAPNSSGSNR
jgi:uncharacterized membrane protein